MATGKVAVCVASAFLDTYLATDGAGFWIDQFYESAAPIARVVPASIFSHIIVAFEELLKHLAPGDCPKRSG